MPAIFRAHRALPQWISSKDGLGRVGANPSKRPQSNLEVMGMDWESPPVPTGLCTTR